MAGRDDDHSSDKPSSGWKWSSSFSASTGGSARASISSSTTMPDSAGALSRYGGDGLGDGFGRGSARPSQDMALVALSTYSPLALHSLRQPVPSDAPSTLDRSVFTFEDAFEDLLAVSQGQPLSNINSRYEQRRLLRSMFADSHEPAWFWLRRLQTQGLLDVPAPGSLLRMATNANWDVFHRKLDRVASDVWRGPRREERDDGFFRDWFGDDRRSDSALDSPARNRGPDHFEEFFSSTESSFPSRQSSWDTFVKSFNNDGNDVQSLDKMQSSKNQEVVKDEYVDRFGYLHSKVTVKSLDDDGNQIGSQTHYAVRPADKKEGDQAGYEEDKDRSGLNVNGRLETKSSWFWR